MKLEVSVAEIGEIIKIIEKRPEELFEMIRLDVKENVGKYLTAVMEADLTDFMGRESYARVAGNDKYRNGSYDRSFTLKNIGEVKVKVPRDRAGEFKTSVLPRGQQYENEISRDLAIMFLGGMSTRTLSLLSERLIGRKISPAQISSANVELTEAVLKWQKRDLSKETVKYIFVDGVCFHMRLEKSIENVPVLAAIGVTQTGEKLMLSLQSGDKESSTSWREFFKDLKLRRFNGSKVTLGIMDGLPGLETVFKEEFPQAKTQRCTVHVTRNVQAKVPKKFKDEVASDLRSIFYAPSK
ncbi:hypothetical protein DS62_09885, partial [Smithella sp. SC_K08D17]